MSENPVLELPILCTCGHLREEHYRVPPDSYTFCREVGCECVAFISTPR